MRQTYLRHHASGALIGVALAGWLASYVSDAAVRVFIGGTTIIFVLHNWIGGLRQSGANTRFDYPAAAVKMAIC